MKIQFYYVRDKNGSTFAAVKSKSISNVYKDLKQGEWLSSQASCDWINVDKLREDNFIHSAIKESLEDLPEPSWEEDIPMLVTLDCKCVNISYAYIENEKINN